MHDAILLALGLLGIYYECLRPGWAVPGIAGFAMLMFAVVGMIRGPVAWPAVIALDMPVLLLAPILLRLALRARRNKISLDSNH